jgi:hypothetical protein
VKRHGFSLIEISIGAVVGVLVLGTVLMLFSAALTGTKSTVDADDAFRATLVAVEAIRADVGRMVCQDPQQDLYVAPDGHAFAVRVPAALAADMWQTACVPVEYALEPLAGGLKRLVRKEDGRAASVLSCVLSDLLVRFVPRGEISPNQAYLEVTVVAANAARSTSATLLPVTMLEAPAAYRVEEE